MHLRIHHPATFAALGNTTSASSEDRPTTSGQGRQLRIADSFAKGTKYQRDSHQWRILTDSVTRLLVEENLPFNLVEKPAFKAMLQAFDKQYVPPDRKYFSKKAVPEKYLKMKDSLTRELKDADHFSLTTDMWSSVNMMPYMSVTIHYLNTNWELKSRCLETSFMPESHTSDNLSEALRSTLEEWSLDETKLACVTSDNGANIVAAVRKLGWGWLPCFGHNLHLAVTNSMKAEKERTARAMGLCRTLVTAFSHSWQKNQHLQKEQIELDLPQHSLVLDCPTRWGTKQKMIARILEQGPAIRRVLDDRRTQHLLPTWQDIEVMESVNAALKSVADFTDALSSERAVTASSLKPVLQLVTEELLLPAEKDTQLTRNLKEKMSAVLLEKYSAPSTQQLLAKTAFVDPRYKDIDIADEVKDELMEEMMNVPEEQRDDGDGERASAPNPPKKPNLADLLGKRKEKTSTPTPKRIRVDTEIRRYLQEEALDSHADPLVWWRDNHVRFPLLSKVARRYMTICATSIPSERVFSAAESSNTLTKKISKVRLQEAKIIVMREMRHHCTAPISEAWLGTSGK
nr:E3 SUMO-protein ligase ZBED1-like [Misgurnus anguillicaudatus]